MPSMTNPASSAAATPASRPLTHRFCDLVMKGGITSGVVYPLAVCEIAKAFHLKNIGGTSAGAIAAAAAAAAEYGRYRQQGGSFAELAQLPDFLCRPAADGEGTNLFAFFQPQERTAAIFNTGVAGLGGGGTAFWRVLASACRSFWIDFVVGASPGLLLIVAGGRMPGSPSLLLLDLGLLVFLVGGTIAVALQFAMTALTEVPRNYFGLCTGMPGTDRSPSTALTPWLTEYLNHLAGLDPKGRPLTFGDLWTADAMALGAEAAINLEMVTTCLTHGRPYRLPFRDDDLVKENRQFFYRREDFAQLFPAQVIEWLDHHRRPPGRARDAAREAEFLTRGFIPLPEPGDLPVVVATRMSLSFPVLLSAIPLFAVDHGRENAEDQWPERCWFSDGGLSSNFPIHFFDSPLPRWPTFGIDLTEKHPDHPPGFYMPKDNHGGALVKWTRFEEGSALGRLFRFLGTIVMSAKDWTDNAQCRLPGFRDRIGQISLDKEDGGLNLNMPRERIQRLCEYGRQAGSEFVRRFAHPPPDLKLNWENHRQVRLRVALAAIEEWLIKLERSCANPQAPDVPYPDLIEHPQAKSYSWNSQSQAAAAADLLRRLRICASAVEALPAASRPSDEAPRPRPELRARPRF